MPAAGCNTYTVKRGILYSGEEIHATLLFLPQSSTANHTLVIHALFAITLTRQAHHSTPRKRVVQSQKINALEKVTPAIHSHIEALRRRVSVIVLQRRAHRARVEQVEDATLVHAADLAERPPKARTVTGRTRTRYTPPAAGQFGQSASS